MLVSLDSGGSIKINDVYSLNAGIGSGGASELWSDATDASVASLASGELVVAKRDTADDPATTMGAGNPPQTSRFCRVVRGQGREEAEERRDSRVQRRDSCDLQILAQPAQAIRETLAASRLMEWSFAEFSGAGGGMEI
ncbi:hypothetical protein MKX08_007340 [Trichoderma sp. CBMAI-0020]|nr:hypothetical protein MKX08_007340 [Trichoderma sp. CBMAI-0020]